MFNNFSDLVKSRFKEKWLSDTAIVSIFRACLFNVFDKERWINLEWNIISIKKEGDVFIIKTRKPTFNSEILILSNEIEQAFLEKINHLSDITKIKIKCY